MTKVVSFAAGMQPTAAQLDYPVPNWARKTIDQIVNNSTTLVNDADLAWAVAASKVYELRVELIYNSGITPDIKWAWTFPTGLTMTWQHRGTDSGGAVQFRGGYTQATVLATGGTAAEEYLTLTGIVTVGVNAGTLQLQWAQNTANASNTIVRAGSYGVLTQIS